MTGADLSKELMNRAGRLLGRRSYSRGELRGKLVKYAEQEEVESVLKRFEELGLLNDAEYAYNFALARMRHDGWGPLKVLHALIRRQVEPSQAESAIERVRHETPDECLLQEYLEKRERKSGLPGDRLGIQKLVTGLRRRGFRDETIFSALRKCLPQAAWQRFDIGD